MNRPPPPECLRKLQEDSLPRLHIYFIRSLILKVDLQCIAGWRAAILLFAFVII